MNRDELEARITEILIGGGDPMDDAGIREAATADPELGASLDELRSFIGKLDEMQWPQIDERKNIHYMTQAFEEGFHQGRTFAAHKASQTSRGGLDRLWQMAGIAAVAVFIGVFAGSFLVRGTSANGEIDQLRADIRGLNETVALSLLENHSPSQRLRGIQWSQQVDEPGDRLITELSETLRRDDNVNVRLAAADAMSRFSELPRVKTALYETVLEESHPLVQVHLIDVILISPHPDAPMVLQRLLENPDLTDVVRGRANAALIEMSDL
jgi:hypothetical protein